LDCGGSDHLIAKRNNSFPFVWKMLFQSSEFSNLLIFRSSREFSFSAILIFSYKAFLACHQQCDLVRKHQCWVVLSFSKKEAVATGMVPAGENDQFSTNQGTTFHP